MHHKINKQTKTHIQHIDTINQKIDIVSKIFFKSVVKLRKIFFAGLRPAPRQGAAAP